MKKSIAMKWVKALRSGKYRQNQDGLLVKYDSNGPRFCCLGVLCHVLDSDQKEFHWKGRGYLPSTLQKAVEMKSHDGKIMGGEFQGYNLVQLNDSKDYSFGAIANVIENNWESL